ncbi:MAG: lipid A deacylase LpxR family protein [Henriciella sp.]|nr:lipid A deacylase LpxR family protein [Henriciella sp.]
MLKTIMALGLASLAPIAIAQEAGPAPRSDDGATVSFVWENDSFAGTDRNYTNGIRLSWLSGTGDTDGVSEWVADRLGADEGAVVRRGISIGHSLFTPEDISATEPLPDQHPYAGWLYTEYTALIQQADQVDQFTLQLGLIGPSAGGEWVQNEFHALIGADEVFGWDNQLRDEMTVGISWDRRFQRLAEFGVGGLSADVTPTLGATLGTVHTNAKVGTMFRIGDDLKVDYGPPRVRPSLSGANFFHPVDGFSWYVFAGAEARWIAHNRFLDGSVILDDEGTLTSEPWVADLQGGIAVQFRKTQIGFTVVYRTEEYEEQLDAQRFGAFTLSRRF